MAGKVSHDSETPAHGQQVFTASAFIHHNFSGTTKIFLPRRSSIKKFFPGVYEMPGGHIDFGEDMANGLKREVKEELGMAIAVGDPFFVFTYHNEIKGSHSIEVSYFAKFVEPIDQVQIDPDDHSEFGWYSMTEVSKIMKIGRPKGEDLELQAINKGFELLSGKQLNFG